MDKEFDTINQMYLSQQFVDDSEEEHQVEECRSMIRAYAFTDMASAPTRGCGASRGCRYIRRARRFRG